MLFPFSGHAQATRVVVTGAGVISSLGQGWRANADALRAGRSTFRPVTLFDVSRQRVGIAAEVDLPALPSGLKCAGRESARLDRGARMLLDATLEARAQAGWGDEDAKIPFVLGTTAGGMPLGEAYHAQAVAAPRRRRLQPTRALGYQAHTQARGVADAAGFPASVCLVSNACASGTDAVGMAWEMIRTGRCARVLAGGHEAHAQLVYSGFDSLQLLSPTVCRPFGANRDGLLLGEGAGVLALESLPAARARGAVILAEVTGYGTAFDSHHLTQPHPQGEAALAAMTRACDAAGIGPGGVDYVNAHGTGTLLNDQSEAMAIARWAGARAATLPLSSTKAAMGHLLGAAGAVEAVVCLMVLREQWLPPQPALGAVDPVCPCPVVREPRDARVDTVLSNSFGFGGVNSTLVFRRWS